MYNDYCKILEKYEALKFILPSGKLLGDFPQHINFSRTVDLTLLYSYSDEMLYNSWSLLTSDYTEHKESPELSSDLDLVDLSNGEEVVTSYFPKERIVPINNGRATLISYPLFVKMPFPEHPKCEYGFIENGICNLVYVSDE